MWQVQICSVLPVSKRLMFVIVLQRATHVCMLPLLQRVTQYYVIELSLPEL